MIAKIELEGEGVRFHKAPIIEYDIDQHGNLELMGGTEDEKDVVFSATYGYMIWKTILITQEEESDGAST